MRNIKYPAVITVHWPTGPEACCEKHAAELLRLGKSMGWRITTSGVERPTECNNCVARAKENDMGLCVVALGDAFSGVTLYGPFKQSDDALAWVEARDVDEDWHLVPLEYTGDNV